MQKVFIKGSDLNALKSGAVIVAVDSNFNKIKVALDSNNKMHLVANTKAAYTGVNPNPLYPASALNLTANETLEGIKGAQQAYKEGKAYKYIVYRSSGIKEGEKTLTRAEQLAQGKARAIVITCALIGVDINSLSSYRFAISQDNTTEMLEEVEYTTLG